jgi:hypothetical protein
VWAKPADVPARLNAFLAEASSAVRKQFGGAVTYASAPWEDIDWTPFDVVSVDAYRDARAFRAPRDPSCESAILESAILESAILS